MMEKIYVGQLQMAHRVSNADVTEKTELRFENGERRFEDPFKLRQEYYVVEKFELDTYMARKEHLEQMNCTPVFGENQRLKAKIANLTEINKSLGEERDRWKSRWNSVVTDIGESLKANGITFVLKEIHGDGNWDVVIDIPELTEAKAKVADLEKKLEAAKSNETFWRDRKEEEEDYHHYWLHTYDRVVKQAADKGIHIGVCGNDEDCNAGIVTLDNMKAEELEKRIVALEKTNKNLNQKIGAADNALEYWNNTYNDIVIAGKKVGVNIDIKGKRSDSNAGFVHVTNQKALELLWQNNYDKKWQAMLDALKDKGVEVIYMGEEDGKPIVDVKIPEIDILKKELEALKSRTLDNVEIRLSCGDIVWTYCDGFVHVSSGMISADEISTGTVPKCSSCAHYMHNPSRFAHDWCYMPIPKEGGAGYIRKLSKEEAEGPACSDFKARKEPECKDCKYHNTAFWRVSTDGEGMATCKSPKTKYGFCQNNCNGEKACPEFEAKE